MVREKKGEVVYYGMDVKQQADTLQCGMARELTASYMRMQPSRLQPPPCMPALFEALAGERGVSSHSQCVSRDQFRSRFGAASELLLPPYAVASHNNAWECNDKLCCSRTHQAFNNVTKNKGARPT